jgi:hypothetical protein
MQIRTTKLSHPRRPMNGKLITDVHPEMPMIAYTPPIECRRLEHEMLMSRKKGKKHDEAV